MVARHKEQEIIELLGEFPIVALLGPRQCGKSTLAKAICRNRDAIYLDLENPDDRAVLTNPTLFFGLHSGKLICLDEVQFMPDIFNILRSTVDKSDKTGQFLLLGSASPELLRQSSETLAGRIIFIELTPFNWKEAQTLPNFMWQNLWLRGGFPRSLLAQSDKSSHTWRKSFVRTFLERDLAAFGLGISPDNTGRLWKMCAHYHGKTVNYSDLGKSLGVSHTTVRHYVDILTHTFMLNLIQPYYVNISKRLVKSPKIYVSDCGVLHSLLEITTIDDLLGHPIAGFSWEGYILQNIKSVLPDWEVYFITTSADAEIDFLLSKGNRLIGIECKFSSTPKLSRGLYQLKQDLNLKEIFVIAPIEKPFYITEEIFVCSLPTFLDKILLLIK